MSRLLPVLTALTLALMIVRPSPADAFVGQFCESNFAAPAPYHCAHGEFCQEAPGQCWSPLGPQLLGRCARVPTVCPRIFRPVCGCNSQTYANDCERMHAQQSKLHNGAC
jgi:hypothetical protein